MAVFQGQKTGDLWEVGGVIRKPHPNPSPKEKDKICLIHFYSDFFCKKFQAENIKNVY